MPVMQWLKAMAMNLEKAERIDRMTEGGELEPHTALENLRLARSSGEAKVAYWSVVSVVLGCVDSLVFSNLPAPRTIPSSNKPPFVSPTHLTISSKHCTMLFLLFFFKGTFRPCVQFSPAFLFFVKPFTPGFGFA